MNKVLDINLAGPIRLTRALLPGMLERASGRIVNIASDAGRVGSSLEAVYSGAKGGLIAFSKTIARESARAGVTVNTVCPGPTPTPLLASLARSGGLGGPHVQEPRPPVPTGPGPVEPIVLNGLTEEFVIDYTPELKRQALDILSRFRIGGLYVPPLPFDHMNDVFNNVGCQGGGNVIPHPPVADPSTGMMYASHRRTCSAPGFMRPTDGVDVDEPEYAVPGADGATPNSTPTTGTTVSEWLPGGGAPGLPTIDGLRLWKPMNNQLSAFQMNTGERIWSTPVGETPERIRNHPLLAGVDIPNAGGAGFGSVQMVTGSLLVQTRSLSEGMVQVRPDAPLQLHARDKMTGEILASVELPAPGQYGMMTYMHQGKQYIVVQIGSIRTGFPGSLVAFALPLP